MGFFLSRLKNLVSYWCTPSAKVILLGLDNVGKTTILFKWKFGKLMHHMPTIYNIEDVSSVKGITFRMWDLGGNACIRPMWKNFYPKCKGIIYVVDSKDKLRLQEAKEELDGVLEDDHLRGVPLVVIANKQDNPMAMPTNEIIQALKLNQVHDRKWHLEGVSVLKGKGVVESLEVLARFIKERADKRT